MNHVVRTRAGRPEDAAAVLELWDRAIVWIVARGGERQWGTAPASENTRFRELAHRWTQGDRLTVAELDERVVGVNVTADTPSASWVPPTPRPQTYLEFLLTDRRHGGEGIGTALVLAAVEQARRAGSEILRVDCWAGAPELVRWYERQGFVRSDTFFVDVRGGWHGQVFEMEL